MAIKEIRLNNFKCFADSGAVPIAPLTVIFGRNNTGKSSLIQSILLLRQTLDSPEYNGPRLNLRGPLYLAGAYNDIVHQHLSSNEIEMNFKIDLDAENSPSSLQMKFSSDEPNAPKLTYLRVETAGYLPLVIHRSVGHGGPYELKIGNEIIGGEKKANFFFTINQFLPLIGPEPSRRGRPNQAREKSRNNAKRVIREFTGALQSTRTLGAFRQPPDRRYEYEGRVHDVVDPLGRNVVNALIEDATRRKRKGELISGVNRWLKAVGRVRLLPIRSISKTAHIFEIRLKDTDSGRWANFADVGF
ncbi:MAG: AAA family ATPase, partial [Phycisphaerae bacterium]